MTNHYAKKILRTMDHSTAVPISAVDLWILAEYMGIHEDVKELQPRLKIGIYYGWFCLNQIVGIEILYLDDDPLCITYQECNDCQKQYFWLSKPAHMLVRKYIESLLIRNSNLNKINTIEDLTDIFKQAKNIEKISQYPIINNVYENLL